MQHQTISRENGADSPHQIEARLNADRNALAASLGALRDRLSFDALWNDGLALVKDNAKPYTHVLDRAIRANPVAVTITAVGLAWLVLGRRETPQQDPSSLSGTKYEALSRWEDEGGPAPEPAIEDDEWVADADRLRDRATAMVAQINAAIANKLAPVADLSRHRTEVLAALSQDLRGVMARGLDRMAGSALDTALAAREKTYDLHVRAKIKASKTVRDNPVIAGAALVAAGALFAALLPQSSTERRVLSTPRDHVMAEARRVLQGERQRIAGSLNRIADLLDAEQMPAPSDDETPLYKA